MQYHFVSSVYSTDTHEMKILMSVLTETIVFITSSSSFEGNTDCDSPEWQSGSCNDSNPSVSDNVTMGII